MAPACHERAPRNKSHMAGQDRAIVEIAKAFSDDWLEDLSRDGVSTQPGSNTHYLWRSRGSRFCGVCGFAFFEAPV